MFHLLINYEELCFGLINHRHPQKTKDTMLEVAEKEVQRGRHRAEPHFSLELRKRPRAQAHH